uniref:Uncharacterized protein n=1 Tax=Oryza punctata TaxID=4537 RepID=A0A0E0JM33_ORYPU
MPSNHLEATRRKRERRKPRRRRERRQKRMRKKRRQLSSVPPNWRMHHSHPRRGHLNHRTGELLPRTGGSLLMHLVLEVGRESWLLALCLGPELSARENGAEPCRLRLSAIFSGVEPLAVVAGLSTRNIGAQVHCLSAPALGKIGAVLRLDLLRAAKSNLSANAVGAELPELSTIFLGAEVHRLSAPALGKTGAVLRLDLPRAAKSNR